MLKNIDSSEITLSGNINNKGSAEFVFTDNGIGIDSDVKKLLFDIFR